MTMQEETTTITPFLTKRYNVQLPNGSVLHVDASQRFDDAVRSKLGMRLDEFITNDHVRMFIYGSVKSAIDKAESEGVGRG